MLNHVGFNYKPTNFPLLLHKLTKCLSHGVFIFTVMFVADAFLIIVTYKSTKVHNWQLAEKTRRSLNQTSVSHHTPLANKHRHETLYIIWLYTF